MIQRVAWDSDFFGYEIGKIVAQNFDTKSVEQLFGELAMSDIKLVYIFPLDEISKRSLREYNIPLTDTKVTFEKESKLYKKAEVFDMDIFSDEADFQIIEELAFVSGHFSRFKTDPNFLNNEFHRLYTAWIRKSIDLEIATGVVLHKKDGKLNGFVSYKEEGNNKLTISLIAVDPAMHGKGIGKMLLQSMENIAIEKKIERICVSTQAENIQAMNFYSTCGYSIIEKQEIYHLWNI